MRKHLKLCLPASGTLTRIVVLLPISAIVLAWFAPGETITIKGSDTMVILGQRWAEAYMKRSQSVIVEVTAGGSGTGISELISENTDICFASRPLDSLEQARLQRRFGTLGEAIPCALDGLAIYVHPSNVISSLTIAQIKGIYTGSITNWDELGGSPRPITVYGRESNSGTYAYLRTEVLEGDPYVESMVPLPGTAAVVSAVAADSLGIGYGGAAYSKGIREIAVGRDEDSPAYEPTTENVQEGLYPLRRILYIYLRGQPEGELKAFVDWILSEEGEAIVREVGYFPLH